MNAQQIPLESLMEGPLHNIAMARAMLMEVERLVLEMMTKVSEYTLEEKTQIVVQTFCACFNLFGQTGDPKDLERAEWIGAVAEDLCPDDDGTKEWPLMALYLAQMGSLKYELGGSKEDLKDASRMGELAIATKRLTPKQISKGHSTLAVIYLLLMDAEDNDVNYATACSTHARRALASGRLDKKQQIERRTSFCLENALGAALIVCGERGGQLSCALEARTVFEEYLASARFWDSTEDIFFASSGLATVLMNLARQESPIPIQKFVIARSLLKDAVDLSRTRLDLAIKSLEVIAKLEMADQVIAQLKSA